MKLAWRKHTPPLSESLAGIAESIADYRHGLDSHFERDRMLLLSLEHLLAEMDGPLADQLDRILDRWTQEVTEQD